MGAGQVVCNAQCHHPTNTGNVGNCYKDAITTKPNSGQTIQQALASVELLDSDSDGVNNVTEILEPRLDQPGQVGYSPGLVGATGTDPCWSNPNQAVTNQLETPPSCYPDCDGDTVLTIDDFICFQTFFAIGCLARWRDRAV